MLVWPWMDLSLGWDPILMEFYAFPRATVAYTLSNRLLDVLVSRESDASMFPNLCMAPLTLLSLDPNPAFTAIETVRGPMTRYGVSCLVPLAAFECLISTASSRTLNCSAGRLLEFMIVLEELFRLHIAMLRCLRNYVSATSGTFYDR